MEPKLRFILLGVATALVSLVAFAPQVEAFFVVVCRGVVNARLDPLVNPNQVSGHLHAIAGGSGIDVTYDYNKLTQSKCSSCSVQSDKSNYWVPNLFWYNVTGDKTYHQLDYYVKAYYLMRPGPKNETINPWPAGLTMLAGNMNRRSFNGSNFADQAVSFVCQDYAGGHQGDPEWDQRNDFFKHNCPNGMRAQLFFPSCWDGKNLDSPDHKSHMAYPIQTFQGGDCPSTHPVHLISLFYEFVFSVQDYPYYPNVTNWVFSTGDTTGYSFHGDFQNGWESGPNSPLAIALKDPACIASGGEVSDCASLQASAIPGASNACLPEKKIPNEPTGQVTPIMTLPGCNPLWSGPGVKPSCNPAVVDPGFISLDLKMPNTWQEIGCSTTGSRNQAFTAATFTDPNMTNEMCMAYCNQQGFVYAGTQLGTQCRCGMRALDATPQNWTQCAFGCNGQINQNCGDRYNVRLFQRCNRPYVECMPKYTSLGCMAEATGRLMQGAAFSNTTGMTPSMCGAFCAKGNYTYAGLEYGQECYCSNGFQGYAAGQLPPTISASQCGYLCPGDKKKSCGGSSTLSVFRVDGKTVCPTDAQLDAAAGPCVASDNSNGDNTNNNNNAANAGGSMVGVAAGAGAGGALLIAGVVGGLFIRRRRQQRADASAGLSSSKAYAATAADGFGASEFSLMGNQSMSSLAHPPLSAMSYSDVSSPVRRVAGPRVLGPQTLYNSNYMSSETLTA